MNIVEERWIKMIEESAKRELLSFFAIEIERMLNIQKMKIGESVVNNGCCNAQLGVLYEDALVLKKAGNIVDEIGRRMFKERSKYEN